MSDTVTNHALRHTLATIAYRTRPSLTSPPEGFPDFDAGHAIRKPMEIVSHMSDVLAFACHALDPESLEIDKVITPDWDMVTARFQAALCELDRILDTGFELQPETAARLLQGPLADVLTHAGQLSMLRRMAGDPVPGENFFQADIQVGKL